MNRQFRLKTWLKPLLIGSTLLTTAAATTAIAVSCSNIEAPSGVLKMGGWCRFSPEALAESVGYLAGTKPTQILFSLNNGEFVESSKNTDVSNYIIALDNELADLRKATSPLPDDYQARIEKYNLAAKSLRYKYIYTEKNSAAFFNRYLKKQFDPTNKELNIEYIDYILETYL